MFTTEYVSCNNLTLPFSPRYSYSTPVIAGVVALLLEVNPELTWRDVQGVLAASAQHNDPTHESWSTNAAGINHSYFYGFGLVDALAAVELARNWTNWGPEISLLASSGIVNVSITDDSTQTATSTITLTETDQSASFVTESVVVYLDLQHGSRGDLKIMLTSPSGTRSLLAPSKRPENTQTHKLPEDDWNRRFKLMTVRNWGESPIGGDWVISLVDEKEGVLAECVDKEWFAFGDSFWASVFDDDFGFDDNLGVDDDFGALYECSVLERDDMCHNGRVIDTKAETLMMDELSGAQACCACGGGAQVMDVSDHMLKSWNIVVYGHSVEEVSAISTAADSITGVASKGRPDGLFN